MYRLTLTLLLMAFFASSTFATYENQQVVHFTKEDNDFFHKVTKICTPKEFNHEDLLKTLREGKIIENDGYKNFVHCSFIETGYAFEDGTVKIERVASLYPDPVLMLEAMKVCDKQRGETAVDNTFEFFKCFQKDSPYLIGIV